MIEVFLSSRPGRDARTASPQGRFAPSPSLSLSLPSRDRDFRSKAGGGGRFASVSRRPTDSHHAACASLSRGGLVPLAPPGRFASITINSFSCSSLRPARPVRIRQRNSAGTPNPEDLWRFEDRKKGEHPSIHDEGRRFGARLWFGNETPKHIPPPYTLFVLFLKRFLLYKSFSNEKGFVLLLPYPEQLSSLRAPRGHHHRTQRPQRPPAWPAAPCASEA